MYVLTNRIAHLTRNSCIDLISYLFPHKKVDALIADVLAKAEQSAGGNSFAASNELLRKFDFGSGQFQGFAAKLPEAALNAIKSHPEVEVVEPDTIVTLDGTQRGLDNGLWGIDVLDGARDGSYTYPDEAGAGVDAYVIDTGIRVQHPDFQGRLPDVNDIRTR